jgi:hypothetical protein
MDMRRCPFSSDDQYDGVATKFGKDLHDRGLAYNKLNHQGPRDPKAAPKDIPIATSHAT